MTALILTPQQISVSLENKEGELRLDSRIVADGFGLPNHTSYRTNVLMKYESTFAELGVILKSTLETGEIVWYLNQDQVNFAGTLAPNSNRPENQSSPFDAIRGYRDDGSEFWTARELMRFLGYIRWDKFIEYIEQAKENLELAGNDVTRHVSLMEGLGTYATLDNPKNTVDYELSRLACYHVALACSGKGKPMVAMAKQYFATQTRKQEIAESIAPVVVERQLPPVRDSIDYLNASKILDAMPEGRLKQLLANKFTAEIALANVNHKQLGSIEPVKQYTTATVRASQLGFSATQIGSGSALGTYLKKEIKPEFSDWQGQFKVNHYKVNQEFDNCILAYFSQRN